MAATGAVLTARGQGLGGAPWKPPVEETLPVSRVRDFPLEPQGGYCRDAYFLQFIETVQLRLHLVGNAWEGVQEGDFMVKVSENELSVAPKDAKGSPGRTAPLESVSGRLKKEVDPAKCHFYLERDVGDVRSKHKILVVELVKKSPGQAWPSEIFVTEMFNRKAFSWNSSLALAAQGGGWTTLTPGRRSDVEDPFVTSRGWLCTELEQGQTDELVHFRIVLDQKKFDEALEKVPYYKLFGADCSACFFKLFVRGDESAPVLLGQLGGYVVPEQTLLEVSKLTREVEGHRIKGTMETLPCLNVTLVKARESIGEWEDLLISGEDELSKPQGSLEEYQAAQMGRDEEDDREDWTPDDWADEQKEKADAAFKNGSFRDAIVYYTRALRHTPRNERLLSNRSACYMKMGKYQLALDDAAKAEEIQPHWSKIFFRKGQALRSLRRFDEAVRAFSEGKDLDGENLEWDREIKRTEDAEATLQAKRSGKPAAVEDKQPAGR